MKEKLLLIKSKCEKLLSAYNKEYDAQMLSDGSYDEDFLKMRVDLIVAVLNKLKFLDITFKNSDEIDSHYYVDSIVDTLIVNTLSWDMCFLNPDEICAGTEEQQDVIKDFQMEIETQIGEITVSKELERLICASADYSEENYFNLCILLNKHIPDLIKSGDIEEKLLDPLYYPVLMHPDAEPYLSEDMSTAFFLIGYSDYYGQHEIGFSYMPYMLPVAIIYVEVAYRLANGINDRTLQIGNMTCL